MRPWPSTQAVQPWADLSGRACSDGLSRPGRGGFALTARLGRRRAV